MLRLLVIAAKSFGDRREGAHRIAAVTSPVAVLADDVRLLRR